MFRLDRIALLSAAALFAACSAETPSTPGAEPAADTEQAAASLLLAVQETRQQLAAHNTPATKRQNLQRKSSSSLSDFDEDGLGDLQSIASLSLLSA